jgi:hypothetical protein
MMEAARTSETSVDNYFTRQYIQEDNSELHTRRRENLKHAGSLKHVCVQRSDGNSDAGVDGPLAEASDATLTVQLTFGDVRSQVCETSLDAGIDVGV